MSVALKMPRESVLVRTGRGLPSTVLAYSIRSSIGIDISTHVFKRGRRNRPSSSLQAAPRGHPPSPSLATKESREHIASLSSSSLPSTYSRVPSSDERGFTVVTDDGVGSSERLRRSANREEGREQQAEKRRSCTPSPPSLLAAAATAAESLSRRQLRCP